MKRLIERIETLPDDDQDAMALVMLEDIDRIETLRAEIDPAIEQLDKGQGTDFRPGMFIDAIRQKHGTA